MMEIRPCPAKSRAELVLEWDQLAGERHRQIASGEDLSFEHVVVPTTFHLLEGADRTLMLDIGSGTGEFTARLARVAERVMALEPSGKSIALARNVCRSLQNVHFLQTTLEEAAADLSSRPATAAVAVMTLMTAPDLQAFAMALAASLQARSRFVAMLTHPWFWPRYWRYEEEPWFDYNVETFIEAPFVISKHRSDFRTTHIHRPLEHYIKAFADQGFKLDALAEPVPHSSVQARYPSPWRFPRFLGLRWEKVA